MQHDHSPYLEQHDDPLAFWDQRIRASRWLIVKTLTLGALAAVLAMLGQGWLESAAPLFPIISQNYGVWQAAYLAALLAIFLLWAAAMLQKVHLLQHSKQGRDKQSRIEEYNARLAQKKEEARLRREERLREQAQERIAPPVATTARSNKFDY